MKVRWTQGSLRLRITPSELAALTFGHPVGQTLVLPGGASWQIVVRPAMHATELLSANGVVEFLLTTADVQRLQDPDAEGVYFATDGPSRIRYFVEKDFPCAHPHSAEACEPDSERFAPTPGYIARKSELILEPA